MTYDQPYGLSDQGCPLVPLLTPLTLSKLPDGAHLLWLRFLPDYPECISPVAPGGGSCRQQLIRLPVRSIRNKNSSGCAFHHKSIRRGFETGWRV